MCMPGRPERKASLSCISGFRVEGLGYLESLCSPFTLNLGSNTQRSNAQDAMPSAFEGSGGVDEEISIIEACLQWRTNCWSGFRV